MFLWALPLLILPWLLRLIKTQKPVLISFSQSYLLKKVMDAYRPKKRSNPWWLILLRMLILLMLIFLLAGIALPQFRTSGPISAILLLDDSLYSHSKVTEKETLWTSQIVKARERLANFSIQTKVAIVTSSGKATEWLSLAQAGLFLSKQKAGYKEENWSRVKGQLQKLLRKREHDEVKLILLGDGKSTQSEGIVNCFAQWPNHDIEVEELDNPYSINFSITGKAKPSTKGTLLELFIDGPNQSAELKFKVIAKDGRNLTKTISWNGVSNFIQWELEGEHWSLGHLSLDIVDRFDFDNHLFFNIEESNYQKIVLLQHQQAEKRLQDSGYYLEKALQNLAVLHKIDFRVLSPRSWNSLTGGKGDLLILHDPPFLSQEESQKIIQFVRRGGKALMMPGPLSSAEAMSTNLGEILPAKLKELSRKPLKLTLPENWKQQLPRLIDTPLRGGWMFYQLSSDTQVLMRFEDGSPFWMQRAIGQGEIHLMSSPFHIVFSDALVQNDLLTLLNLITNFALNANVNLEDKLNAGEAIGKKMESILPILSLSRDFDSSFIEPGVYEVQQNGKNHFLSCNVNAKIEMERLPYKKNLTSTQTVDSFSITPKRVDTEIAILLLFLVLIEIFSLHQLQKPSLKRSY